MGMNGEWRATAVPWLGTLCPTPTDHEPWWDAAARLGSPRGRIWGQITSTAARGWEAMTGKPYSYFTEPAVQKGSLACLGAGRKPTSQGWDRSCPISLRTPILSAPHEPVQLSPTPAEAGRGIWGCSSLYHGSPALLELRASQTVAASATPSNQPHLCRERQKGKGALQGAVGREGPLSP